MSFWINHDRHLESFHGKVRLFPLPNFVMFPGVVKGLHIFEPRYCAMLQESLSTDQLMAMALLKPGWEAEYYEHPAIYDVVCIGKVIHHAPTPEGRHNILLSGLKRARIIREDNTSVDHFRRAQAIVIDDVDLGSDAKKAIQYRSRLMSAFRKFSPTAHLFSLEPEKSIASLSLGLLVDLLAQELPLGLSAKQYLLSELNVELRCHIVLTFLENRLKSFEESADGNPDNDSNGGDGFPPRVSWN